MFEHITWLEILVIGLAWDFGGWLFKEIKLRYKIKKGTVWRDDKYTIQGPMEWVERTAKTLQSSPTKTNEEDLITEAEAGQGITPIVVIKDNSQRQQ